MKPLTAYIPTGLNEFQEEDQKRISSLPPLLKINKTRQKKTCNNFLLDRGLMSCTYNPAFLLFERISCCCCFLSSHSVLFPLIPAFVFTPMESNRLSRDGMDARKARRKACYQPDN